MLSEEEFARDLARSFVALWQFRQDFQRRNFGTNDAAARSLTLFWEPIALPNFEIRGGIINSRQQDFFTVFPLAEALRGFLIGVEQSLAYKVLQEEDYDQLAVFSAYTACFHLIDSFLCLSGIYYVPDPVGDCAWKLARRMTDPRARGAPMYILEPSRLITRNRSPNFVVAHWTESNSWTLEAQDIRSVHASRWKDFGKELKALLRANGTEAIPRPIRQFFNFFGGHLAYLGISQEGTDVPLAKLIDFGSDDTNFRRISQHAHIPHLRNLAIYRNQTLDDLLRRVAPAFDTSITGPPTKLSGTHFARLATGLIRWQNERLTRILTKAESILREQPRVFRNGIKGAILFSGLVELDHSKIVDNDIYNNMHPSIRENISPIFRTRRYVASRLHSIGWNAGTARQPQIHALAIPITIPDILTQNNDWFRRSISS
jgi:hypothetical protein